MKSRRSAAVALTAVLSASLGLAACGTQSQDPAPTASAQETDSAEETAPEVSDDPVTLRVFWWGGDGRHERTQQAIELFESTHENITVEPEFSDWAGYWDKLATATAGGNAPDLMQMDQLYLASYAERGTLADLSSLSQIDTSGMDDAVLGMGKAGDGLYGMPISVTGLGVLVNVDLLNELGVGIPDDSTWTWDDFDAWTASVTEASDGEVYGTTLGFIEFQLQLFARQLGDKLFDGSDIVVSAETMEQFFQKNLDWVNNGGSPNGSVQAERVNLALDQLDFSVGKAASLFSPSTTITAYTAALNDANLELLKLPTVDDVQEGWQYLKPGMYWSISSKSEHPAEAALLLDFLVNDPEAAKILGVERGIPATSAALEAIRPDLTGPEAKAVEFAESLDLGEAPAIVPTGAAEVQSVLQRYALEVVLEQKTPAEAAEAFIAEMQTAIAAAN